MSLKSATYLLWLLLFCAFTSANAQTNYYANTREIGVADGLLHKQVFCVLAEDQGVWIGTQAGLSFFDGFTFRDWTRSKDGLSRNSVNNILKDQEGTLWLFSAYARELVSIDLLSPSRDSIQSFEERFKKEAPFEFQDIEHFFTDNKHCIYFLANNGLWKYQVPGGFSQVRIPTGFIPQHIFSTGELAGRVGEDFAWIDRNQQLHLRKEYKINNFPLTVYGTPEHFWLKQSNNDILVYSNDTSSLAFTSIPDEYGQRLFYDQVNNNYWATSEHFLQLYDKYGNKLYEHKIKTPIYNLEIDQFGTAWLSTYHGLKLLRLEKPKFKRFLHSTNKEFSPMKWSRCRGLYQKDEFLYANTYQGRHKIALSSGQSVFIDSSELMKSFPIMKDSSGYFWSASYELNYWDKQYEDAEQKYFFDRSQGRGWSLFEDANNKIWLGAERGLCYYQNGQVHPFKAYNGFEALANSTILSFYKDRQGSIWLTTNTGLYLLNTIEGILERYWNGQNENFYLPSNDIQHIHQDTDGIYWLASADEGLIRWDKKTGKTQSFSRKEGFPSANIYAVYEDDFGYLWLPSNYGLIRFHKESYSFQSFFEDDGISNNEFNRISHFRGQDGTLYFGSQNGITAFHPKDFAHYSIDEQSMPRLELESHRFFSMHGPELAPVDIDWNNEYLSLKTQIRFASFKVHYPDLFWTDQFDLHYQLEILGQQRRRQQPNGNYVSPDNIIRLVGLIPGNYKLRVEARRKNGGVYMADPIDFAIHLPLPWHHQTWFRSLVIVLALLIALGIFQWRTKQLKKRQIELEILVKERTEKILANHQVIEKQALQIQQMQDQLNQKDQNWLSNLEQTVQHKLGNIHLDLSEIINDMGTSRSAFYEKVKELTNMTPNQYLQEARMQKALELLEKRECHTVKEVALSVGIKKPSYFSKLFKERFGKLPSTYF